MPTRRGKKQLLGNHQSSWVWGRNVISEVLRSAHWLPLEVVIADDLGESIVGPISEQCRTLAVAYQYSSRERLQELCKVNDHQGFLAKMPAFPYAELDNILVSDSDSIRNQEGATDLKCVILDGIQDSHNLGAILRSALVFGFERVILGNHHQVGINSQVVRSAAGAISQLQIAKSPNLLETIRQLNEHGTQTVAATLSQAEDLPNMGFSKNMALVIGNESCGIRQEIADACQHRVRIPQRSDFDSLNAAVAAGILLYEATRSASIFEKH